MVYRCNEIGLRQWISLRIRDGHTRNVREFGVNGLKLRKVEPTVQRRQEWCRLPAKQREGPVIQMRMQHVEFVGTSADLFHQQHVRSNCVAQRRIKTKCLGPYR